MAKIKVGRVSHYYDKLGVAIIDLTGALSVGDKVVFERGGEELFSETVGSIQIEHDQVESAGKGDIVGVKVNEVVKEGAEVYKL
ncbi:hypothetical protein A2630_00185 [Candidatus Woesebacteria bacterium RIFCSPHIGHO2_01_FULL_44_10]|uniref:Translation elongation factor-like protein n=1 Tax=Candidatus Woesebacteria bacterium RIFCSPLOWO2_01_FULL_44_14 TaxID=1802525 RepID=A0A1F8BX90_9BACT|nr:MAG: hypothetical protein A2630_00185 [Candidatus Woesebacteria bacterium RIFCSPHIGHO2_01_FULL_44_10]OGM56285.1 MAG: hypothetical protein A3F62_03505 [Candidatus Woesebacteria bacterium RIFCSPHIGHO2_12_FULL_44_11]OGM68721.1 MAG: hypothetical protein A2975_05485 [Candidatus Woesebacteria bacterium RIFCSPLOWO2_01_FULL_44_14]